MKQRSKYLIKYVLGNHLLSEMDFFFQNFLLFTRFVWIYSKLLFKTHCKQKETFKNRRRIHH